MNCTHSITAALLRRRCSVLLSATTVGSAFLLGFQDNLAKADIAYSFGTNQYGELGNGVPGDGSSNYSMGTPAIVNVLDNKTTVTGAGGAHSLVADNGALYAFGLNNGGQLGNNTNTGTGSNPNPLPGLVLTNGITSFQAGIYFSMALANGAVYTWGPNSDNELGSTNIDYNSEEDVPTLTANPILSTGVTAIAAGGAGGFAVQRGALYSWGLNSAGQTGNGTFDPTVYVTTPTAVPVMTSGVTSVSASINHSIGVMNGHAYAWGFNQTGQLGTGGPTGPSATSINATPTPVVGLPPTLPVSAVSAGGNSSYALVKGIVYAWGANNVGQLGNGTTSRIGASNQVPTAISTINGFIVDVKGGTSSGYALASDGTIWSWGGNAYGQLGNGTNGSTNASNNVFNTPQHLVAPAGYVYTGIGAGASSVHVIATIGVAPSSWALDSSGNWNDPANWSSGVPNSVDAPVTFTSPPITGTRTITATTPITVGNLSFTSANSYIIQGSGSITVQANLASSVRGAAINDYVGDQTVAPATLEFATSSNLNVSYGSTLTLGSTTGNIVVDSNTAVSETGYGAVAFTSMVSLQSGASLNLVTPTSINGLTLAANASTAVAAHSYFTNNLLQLGSLSMTATSKLEIANNEAIVHNGNPASLTTSLAQGLSGGWNGPGIVSSFAASDTMHLTAVGSLVASSAMTAGGQSLAAGDVLLKYTYYGDADLNGIVDGSDYSRIDSSFVVGNATGWNNGDFNYDGVINGSDYTLIDNAFNSQGAQINAQTSAQFASYTAEIAIGSSAVPEPASLTLLSIGLAGLLGRRNRVH